MSVAAGLLGLARCSLWVASEPEQIGCADEGKLGPPGCGTGFICARHICEHCVAREVCGDKLDNDCNGRVDDGCSNVSEGGAPGNSALLQSAPDTAKPAGAAGAD